MPNNFGLSTRSNVILYIVNASEFFLSHRLPIALAMQKAGFEVHVASANGFGVRNIESYGFIHHVVPFSRSSQGLFNELHAFFSLVKLFRSVKPDIVHLVTIKPVIYGGIAARLTKIKSVVIAISGLGTVFISFSFVSRIRRYIVQQMYRSAFKIKHLTAIFQNPDDRDQFLKLKALRIEQTEMIRGSGVSLDDYPYLPEPEDKIVVVMAARLLKDKGVNEFIEAGKLLSNRGFAVQFRLIGSIDTGNKSSLTQRDVDQLILDNKVELIGFRNDIAAQYSAANIVCLPSYREGLPKSLIEAAACGRAVVTTDVPGCRDAITPGETGLLVPVKDVIALTDAIQSLIKNPELRKKMGKAGRALAEREFAIEKIVNKHIDIYKSLLKS